MSGVRLIGLIGVLLLVSACATPISVTQLDSQTAQRELTRNVLSAGEPSRFSQIILNRADLQARFADDPETALWTLHTEVVSGRRGANQLFPALRQMVLIGQDPELAVRYRGRMSSVYGMTPGSPLITELAPASLVPGVTGHSIVAVIGDGPFQDDTDGVVAYSSAHLDGMASELVVTSGHSVQQHPEAIEEVRRILIEHAAGAVIGGVSDKGRGRQE